VEDPIPESSPILRTGDKYAGSGPISTRPGDEVWLLGDTKSHSLCAARPRRWLSSNWGNISLQWYDRSAYLE